MISAIKHLASFAALFTLCAPVCAAEALPARLEGDVGMASYTQSSQFVNGTAHTQALPYTYFDYGRLFARIDTFGIKTVPLLNGYLEIKTTVRQDGYRITLPATGDIRDRRDSVPLGIGTLQETPYGDFFLDLYHDTGTSKGNFFQGLYAAELDTGIGTLYPQVGIEYLSGSYTGYYYGVSAGEAGNAAAYSPSGSTALLAGGMLELHLTGDWYGNLYWRRKWADHSISNSPIVAKSYQDTYFASVAYRFQ